MIEATAADKPLVLNILTRSFAGNHSVQYVVGGKDERRIRGLMDYSFNRCLRFGKVYLTEDRTGCALVLFPDGQRTTLSTIRADLRLAVSVIGLSRIGKVMKRERRIQAAYPDGQRYYLWFVGVMPDARHRGTGSRLLRELMAESRAMGRPLYLETSMEDNLTWYRRHGLEVYHQLAFDYPLYLMRAEPSI